MIYKGGTGNDTNLWEYSSSKNIVKGVLAIDNDSDGKFLKWDNGTDSFEWVDTTNDLVYDVTPQLGGDLHTNGNRIHGSLKTFLDLSHTLSDLSGDLHNNQTVLASVKSIYLFLDSNGGNTGQSFRIYNDVEADLATSSTTPIFEVHETGNVDVTGTINSHTIPTGTGTLALTTDIATAKTEANAYTDTAISNLVDSAPDTLNTLNELAVALNANDSSDDSTATLLQGLIDTNATAIATKLSLSGGTMTGNIVMASTETVDGRDLSVDGAKLDLIEDNADVTDTANVTAAGALMDSEVTNLAQVKAFDTSEYATSAQGALADSALQSETISLTALKAVVALSSDFADFKTRIAGL
jgi:hypothetical protein